MAVVGIRALTSDSSSAEHEPRIAVVRASSVIELPSASDPRLVLRGTHQRLVAGEFLTTEPDWSSDSPHAPEGFLLKVEDWEVSGDETVVEVEPASLFEAEPEAALGTAGSHFSPVATSSVEEPTLRPFEAPVGSPVFARASLAAGVPLDRVGEVGQSLQQTFGCGGSGEIEVAGRVDTSLEPGVELVWSRRKRLSVDVEHAAAWVEGTATATLKAEVRGDLSCEPDPIVLVEPSWRTVVIVGQVPVPVTISLPIELSASAQAHGEASASATIKSDATLGVSRRGEGRPELIKGFNPPTLKPGLELKLGATGNAEVAVLPAVNIEAGWRAPGLGKLAAAAKLGVRGSVHFGYAVGRQPPWHVCFPIATEASLTLHLLRTSLGPWTAIPRKLKTRCRPQGPEASD